MTTTAERTEILAAALKLCRPFEGEDWEGMIAMAHRTEDYVATALTKLGHRVTCSRCGGGGRYSYNHMDGDRCYGCGGKGTKVAPLTAKLLKTVIASIANGELDAVWPLSAEGRRNVKFQRSTGGWVWSTDEEIARERALPSRTLTRTMPDGTTRTAIVHGGHASLILPNGSSTYAGVEFEKALAWAEARLADL